MEQCYTYCADSVWVGGKYLACKGKEERREGRGERRKSDKEWEGEERGGGRWKRKKGRRREGVHVGVKMGGRSGHASPDACLGSRNDWAERVDSQADLGWRVSYSAPRIHIHILPERLCIAYPSDSFALISEEAGRNAALKFAHWLLEYQLRLLGGFGRDLASTTKSFPCVVEALPRACLRREAEPIRWDVSACKCVDV